MKQPYILAAVIALASLTSACNGGGASGPPLVTGTSAPTPSPSPLAFSAKIVQLTGAVRTAGLRRSPRDVASPTPAPVVITAPEPLGRFSVAFDTVAVAQVVVAPAPSSTPTVAWSVPSNAPVSFSPVSGQHPDQIAVSAQQPTVFTSTVTANVAAPVSQVATTTLAQQPRGILGCVNAAQQIALGSNASDYRGGFAITSGAAPTASDRQHADLAIVGPDCAGSYTDVTVTERTVVSPFGMDLLCDRHDVFDVHIADWTGHTAVIPTRLFNAGCVALFKTQTGAIWAWFLYIQEPGQAGTTNTSAFTGPLAPVTI